MQNINPSCYAASSSEEPPALTDETEQARVASTAVVRFAQKTGPAADSSDWYQQYLALQQRHIEEMSEGNATVSYLREELKQTKEKVASLEQQNSLLIELLKPYVNDMLEQITKCLVRGIATDQEALARLKTAIQDRETVTPREVMTALIPLLNEADKDAGTISQEQEEEVLETQVNKLKGVIQTLNLRPEDMEQQIPVQDLELERGGEQSYWRMAGNGAVAFGSVLWGGTKLGGRLAIWVCKNLVPLLTCGMVSAVVLESPWTPVLMFLLKGF